MLATFCFEKRVHWNVQIENRLKLLAAAAKSLGKRAQIQHEICDSLNTC